MPRNTDWTTISEEAKTVISAIDDDSFLNKSDGALQIMRRECRKTTWNNALEQNAVNQAIAAISDELLSRNTRRTNAWLIVLTALTLLVAVAALVVPFFSK